MSWEITWRLDWRDLRTERVRQAVAEVLKGWPGATMRVEQEDSDTISCFVEVPADVVAGLAEAASGMDEDGSEDAGDDAAAEQEGEALPASYTLELSFYDLDQDGRVMSLEGEWSDNAAAWDAACTLADELAEELDAEPLDL